MLSRLKISEIGKDKKYNFQCAADFALPVFTFFGKVFFLTAFVVDVKKKKNSKCNLFTHVTRRSLELVIKCTCMRMLEFENVGF